MTHVTIPLEPIYKPGKFQRKDRPVVLETDSKRCSRCGQYYQEINNSPKACTFHEGVFEIVTTSTSFGLRILSLFSYIPLMHLLVQKQDLGRVVVMPLMNQLDARVIGMLKVGGANKEFPLMGV